MSDFLSQVFDAPDWAGVGTIAAKTTAVFVLLVVGLRLLGKRELGQMNLYDLVLIVILGNAVQNAMLNGDNTLAGGVVAAITLLALNRLLNLAVIKSSRLQNDLVGHPKILVSDGEFVDVAMRAEGVNRDQVFAALREHGIGAIRDVRLCVLEVDGTISVVPSSSPMLRTKRHFRGLRLP